MARQPEVFVRELDPTEIQRLMKITADGAGPSPAAAGRSRAGLDPGSQRWTGRGVVGRDRAVRVAGVPRLPAPAPRPVPHRAAVAGRGAVEGRCAQYCHSMQVPTPAGAAGRKLADAVEARVERVDGAWSD